MFISQVGELLHAAHMGGMPLQKYATNYTIRHATKPSQAAACSSALAQSSLGSARTGVLEGETRIGSEPGRSHRLVAIMQARNATATTRHECRPIAIAAL